MNQMIQIGNRYINPLNVWYLTEIMQITDGTLFYIYFTNDKILMINSWGETGNAVISVDDVSLTYSAFILSMNKYLIQ